LSIIPCHCHRISCSPIIYILYTYFIIPLLISCICPGINIVVTFQFAIVKSGFHLLSSISVSHPSEADCWVSEQIIFTVWSYQPHAQPPTWSSRVSHFVWVITLDLSIMGGPTSSIRYRQHSPRAHMTTQAPPLRQSRDTFGGN